MSRPRIAVIMSAVAGSTTAFLVTSKWHLAGTVVGAAIVPVVYTLVSHSSSHGVEHLGKWVRRGRNRKEPREPEAPKSEEAPAGMETPKGRASRAQWWLAGITCLALAFSVYALAVSDDAESTVVRETVIRTVTVTSEATQVAQATLPTAQTANSRSAAATASAAAVAAGAATTTTGSTTTTTTTEVQGAGATSTTTTLPTDGDGSSTTTTAAVPSTSTSSSSTSTTVP